MFVLSLLTSLNLPASITVACNNHFLCLETLVITHCNNEDHHGLVSPIWFLRCQFRVFYHLMVPSKFWLLLIVILFLFPYLPTWIWKSKLTCILLEMSILYDSSLSIMLVAYIICSWFEPVVYIKNLIIYSLIVVLN